MQKRMDGVIEPSEESLIIFQIVKELKALSRKVERLEKQVNCGNQ